MTSKRKVGICITGLLFIMIVSVFLITNTQTKALASNANSTNVSSSAVNEESDYDDSESFFSLGWYWYNSSKTLRFKGCTGPGPSNLELTDVDKAINKIASHYNSSFDNIKSSIENIKIERIKGVYPQAINGFQNLKTITMEEPTETYVHLYMDCVTNNNNLEKLYLHTPVFENVDPNDKYKQGESIINNDKINEIFIYDSPDDISGYEKLTANNIDSRIGVNTPDLPKSTCYCTAYLYDNGKQTGGWQHRMHDKYPHRHYGGVRDVDYPSL